MLKAGARIGDWIIDAPLGEGGMGAVYRVHSALSERVEAALKVLKPSPDPDSRHLFVREAEALAALRHPAVVRVMGFAEDPARGVLYLVMELARGETLRERMARGPMPLAEVLRTFVPLCHGLEHAHAAGIYHRDLKPSNVVLTPDGVRLVDFGIAAAAADKEEAATSGHLGTLAYLPPEVFRGEGTRPRDIDVYAFGLLLHESLTGQRVFTIEPGLPVAGAAAAVGAQKRRVGPLDPGDDAPAKLRELIRRATDPSPAQRPDMAEICRGLESLVERRGGAAGPGERMAIHGAAAAANAVRSDPTVRVPDPKKSIVIGRSASASRTAPIPGPRPRPANRGRHDRRAGTWTPLVAAGIAILLLVLLALALGRRDSRGPRDPERLGSRTRASATPSRAAARRPRETAATPTPTPPPVAAPGAFPTIPTPSPIASAEPAAEPAEAAPPPPADDVSGDWLVVNRVQATSYAPYRGLRVTYRLNLRQNGDQIVGEGEKAYEDGTEVPEGRRTPITVLGRIEGDSVVLDFIEEGSTRTSHGRFRWTVVDGRLEGRFASDAASSRGISIAQRER